MNPDNHTQNQAFRKAYRESQIGPHYNGLVHLSFTLGFAFSVIFYSLWQLGGVLPLEYLTVPITFVYANLVEYFAHKGPMHRPFKGLDIIYKRHATQHHIFFTDQFMQFDSSRDFKAVLFPPILICFFMLFFALPAGLLVNWLFSSNISFLFVITAFSYFACYEILHTIYHLPENHWCYRFKILRTMRQLHKDHHQVKLMSRYNFNITFPIGDLLFGTFYRQNSDR